VSTSLENAVVPLEALERALAKQPFRRDVPVLDVRKKRRLDPRGLGFLTGFVSLDFGLTTISSCFLIWLETVRDQPVPTLPM
jgi:hypothetical protein